jgi:hypothetical protein
MREFRVILLNGEEVYIEAMDFGGAQEIAETESGSIAMDIKLVRDGEKPVHVPKCVCVYCHGDHPRCEIHGDGTEWRAEFEKTQAAKRERINRYGPPEPDDWGEVQDGE